MIKFTFNPSYKITKRHMDVLAQYIPVSEYGYPTRYFTCSEEFKTRASACRAMLDQLYFLSEAGILPKIESMDLDSHLTSNRYAPLFTTV
jgi:hypothetical protein